MQDNFRDENVRQSARNFDVLCDKISECKKQCSRAEDKKDASYISYLNGQNKLWVLQNDQHYNTKNLVLFNQWNNEEFKLHTAARMFGTMQFTGFGGFPQYALDNAKIGTWMRLDKHKEIWLSSDAEIKLGAVSLKAFHSFHTQKQLASPPVLSDMHRSGNCFVHRYKGSVTSDGSKIFYDACSIYVVKDEDINGKKNMAFNMIHASLDNDPLAKRDQLFFQVTHLDVDHSKNTPQSDDTGRVDHMFPHMVIVNSKNDSTARLAWTKKEADNLLLKYVTNPLAVNMVIYKEARESKNRVVQFESLEGTSRGSMISIYAVKLDDGSTDFILCRKDGFEKLRSQMQALQAKKETKRPR